MARVKASHLENVLSKGGVPAIVWKVRNDGHQSFDYMAIWVERAKRWYIAGDAKYYGSPVKTTEEMLVFLNDIEVKAVFKNRQDWDQLNTD